MAKTKSQPPDFFFEELQNIANAMANESERGTVILSATMPEEALGVILKTKMHKNVDDKLLVEIFRNNGPLSTFSSRIKMSYVLGLISANESRVLNVIRDIRNDFAHFRKPMPSLDDQTYTDRINNISDLYPVEWDSTMRLRFAQICAAISINITHMRVGMTQPCDEAHDFTSDALFHSGLPKKREANGQT